METRDSEMETREEQLWKANDRRANKTGPRSTVFWVRRQGGGGRGGRLAGNRSAPKFVAGAKYAGEWQDNRKHGYGTQTWPSGDKYEGDWERDQMHGKGTYWVKHRSKLRKQYTGDWRHGKRHVRCMPRPIRPAARPVTRHVAAQGLGIFFYRDGGKYEGEWVQNRRHGRGKMIYADGNVYEGDWQEDKRDGPGVLSLGAPRPAPCLSRRRRPVAPVNGDRYEGHWRGDEKEGTGRYFYFATNKMYEGEWAAGVAKCGVFMDTPPGLSDYQAQEGDEPPPDAFDLPAVCSAATAARSDLLTCPFPLGPGRSQLGLKHPAAVFVDAVTAIRRLRQSRDEGEALAHAEEAFSEKELDQLRAAFAEADVDGRGEVAGHRLGTVLAHLVGGPAA